MRIACGLLLVACTQDPAAPLDRPDVLAIESYQYHLHDGRVIPAEIGRLWIPSNSRSTGVSLGFVRLPTTGPDSGPPIIYLAGGPGGSGIETGRGERFNYFQNLRQVGDVILLDQRGTGISTPGVACNRRFDLPADQLLDRAAYANLMTAQVSACATDLASQGFDPADYTPLAAVEDLEQLRLALGVEQIILVGYSYGTHLALAYMRKYESRVARAVLHGTEGPDHTLKLPSSTQAALHRLDTLIQQDLTYGPRLTNLLDSLSNSLAALAAQPESIMVGDTLVVFGELEARVLLANELGNRSDLEELPAAIVGILENGWGLAAPAVLALKRTPMLSGLSYAADCAAGATPARLAQIASETSSTLLGDAINFPWPDICPPWQAPDLGNAYRSPITSSVPTLFVAGNLDARTPIANAVEVSAGFANGQILIVENAGHNDLATSTAIINPVLAFLRTSGIVPSSVALPAIRFSS